MPERGGQLSALHSPTGDYSTLPLLASALTYEDLYVVSPSSQLVSTALTVLGEIEESEKVSRLINKVEDYEWIFSYFDTLKDLRKADIVKLDPDYSALVESFPSIRGFRSKLHFYRNLLQVKDLLARDPSSIFFETPQHRTNLRLIELDVFPEDLREAIIKRVSWPTKAGRLILRANKAGIRYSTWWHFFAGNLPESSKHLLYFLFTLPHRFLATIFLPYGLYTFLVFRYSRAQLEDLRLSCDAFYMRLSESRSHLFLSDDPLAFIDRIQSQSALLADQNNVLEKYGVKVSAERLSWLQGFSSNDVQAQAKKSHQERQNEFEYLSRQVLSLMVPQLRYRNAEDILRARHVTRDELAQFRAELLGFLKALSDAEYSLEEKAERVVVASKAIHRKLFEARNKLPRALFQTASSLMSMGIAANKLLDGVSLLPAAAGGLILGVMLCLREYNNERKLIQLEADPPVPTFLLKLPWKTSK